MSEQRVREGELSKLISSAYIGMSIYSNGDENNKLTLLSSEKNARYCQNGIPFVCLYCEESNVIYQEHRYFEMVRDVKDIPEAIKKIDQNYDAYRSKAFEAFNRYYSFDNNFEALLNVLN